MRSDVYLRKSTADAGRSIGRQERDWRSDNLDQGFECGQIFADPDRSASRYATRQRPDYQALVSHVSSGRAEMVSLWEAARGSREMAVWVAFLDLCRDHRVLIRIFGGDEPRTFDPRVSRDRETLLQEGISSERESEVISKRARSGLRNLALTGRPPGPLLYPFTREYDEKGKFVSQMLHPERSAITRRLRDDTFDGVSLNAQAQRLNQEGVPSPGGGRWTNVTIARILLNPALMGKRLHNGVVVADGQWEVLFTEEEHLRLVRVLSGRGRTILHDTVLRHELSGAARCGECGSLLRTVRAKQYACRTTGCMKVAAAMAPMEELVTAMVRQRLREPEGSRIFAPAENGAVLDAARRELEALEGRLAAFVDQAADPKVRLSAKSLAAVEAKLLPQIEVAEKRVRELETPAVLSAYRGVDVAAEWPGLPIEARREFVAAVADVVLSPAGRGVRWSSARLAGSRYRHDELTWGERWARAGLPLDV